MRVKWRYVLVVSLSITYLHTGMSQRTPLSEKHLDISQKTDEDYMGFTSVLIR